jgi:mannose-6-phosphate isomerase
VSLLPTRMVAMPWGRAVLPPPFAAPAGELIGEIWFEPPPALDALLVKYIFTAEALSVQVHPSDAQTLAAGLGKQGKDECWLVVDAQPDAKLGIGFRDAITPDAMRAAALDGSIEGLLEWYPASVGDFFYIPAGTVHAIGAGVTLIEVQQCGGLTYRLYDYGRARTLHLDQGIGVAHGGPHDPALRRRLPERGAVTLAEGPLFRLDRLDGPPDAATIARYAGPLLVIPLDVPVLVNGAPIARGACAMASTIAAVECAGRCLITQQLG